DLVARPNVVLRPAMAVEAPLHQERVFLPDQRHLIDPAVTRNTADAFLDVDTVIEINEAGQIGHALPGNRLPGAGARAHRLEHTAAGPDLLMAIHARLGRWNAGEGRLLDGSVAITAVDTELTDVVRMTKRHRLNISEVRLGDVRRAIQDSQKPARCRENED